MSGCTAKCRPVLFKEGAAQKQDHNFQTAMFRQEVLSGHKFQSGLGTKACWLTDSQSWSNFDFDFEKSF
jgi:hypothetical protein